MNESRRIQLSGDLTIYRAAELKEALLSPLEADTDIEIDLSAVSELDAAGLQLLILAKREGAHRNARIHYIAHSPAVVEVIELCNLASFFGDPILLQTH